jgi:hexokinase
VRGVFQREIILYWQIENHVAKLRFSAATARKIQDVFISEMNKGIHQQSSSLQMENTYIPELLDGTGH